MNNEQTLNNSDSQQLNIAGVSCWHSVKDVLPEKGEYVLVIEAKFGRTSPNMYIGWIDEETGKWGYQCSDGTIDDCENNPDYYFITHWMELPPYPVYACS